MPEFKLHCFAQSGNAYKAALMLALCGADWKPQFVDFFNGETRSESFRKLNPMGEVPVLEHRDEVFSQSGVILDYLADTLNQFAATNEQSAREILRWILFDNHKLTGSIAVLRFLRTFTRNGENDVTRFYENRSKNALQTLENHLQQNPFVVDQQLSIADISICGYLYYDDEFGFSLGQYTAIQKWLDSISAMPGWQHPYEMMPGHPLTQA
ncbi:MAG: glutathione S-transferase [Pseudomonadota bacterium]